MNSGKINKDVLFSIAFNPFEKESLFQKSNISNKIGDAIQAIKMNCFLEYFNLLKNSKLNAAKKIINNEHGFLKIIATAITHIKM